MRYQWSQLKLSKREDISILTVNKMISQRIRENRRARSQKLPKKLERIYKEVNCRDCAVVVTRMDFAKILGKFTKVKIQYESSSTPKTKKNAGVTSPTTNSRLKCNENGMVLIHRNAYNPHPVKELLNAKKIKTSPVQNVTPRQATNVLKENNRVKKTPLVKDKNSNISCYKNKKKYSPQFKQYGIVFADPSSTDQGHECRNKISLSDLLPLIENSILPNEEWCIDYLPRNEEPMNDKVYDRIAAELEDLMYNEKSDSKVEEKIETPENKVDDFPSIMDILNDNSSESSKTNDQSSSIVFKANIESSDLEAMLLGKATTPKREELETTPMDVVNTDMSNLIEDVAQLNSIQDSVKIPEPIVAIENPHSPSILDEALQKGIEEHLPCENPQVELKLAVDSNEGNGVNCETQESSEQHDVNTEKTDELHIVSDEKPEKEILVTKQVIPTNITCLIFKNNIDGRCFKSVTCLMNLKYIIELDGKTVEFLGAPKFISSLDDLQVLLQIVHETELKNLYVCH